MLIGDEFKSAYFSLSHYASRRHKRLLFAQVLIVTLHELRCRYPLIDVDVRINRDRQFGHNTSSLRTIVAQGIDRGIANTVRKERPSLRAKDLPSYRIDALELESGRGDPVSRKDRCDDKQH